jgi:sugar O-acyltransferase (sialic acid O-acetyltransferase NeuD family)
MRTTEMSSKGPTKLLILGAGGLGSEYAWVAEAMNEESRRNSKQRLWEILGYADDDLEKKGKILRGHEVDATVEEVFTSHRAGEVAFAVAIGSNRVRERIARRAEENGWIPATLVHPSVIIASDAEIGPGSYLAPGSVVCPGARVGRHVIVNTHVSIGHDSVLEDFVQLCPGTRVSGGCRIEICGFLGSNASLAPGVVVGKDAVVGANSFVVRKVSDGTTVLGCPAMPMGRTRR